MKKIVLFGAGQAGAAVSRLLGADWEAVCFADNDREKWGAFLEDLPVLSPAESLLREPDCFCLCALNAGRREQMARQLPGSRAFFPCPSVIFTAASCGEEAENREKTGRVSGKKET